MIENIGVGDHIAVTVTKAAQPGLFVNPWFWLLVFGIFIGIFAVFKYMNGGRKE